MDISNHLNWLRQYYLGADQALSVDPAEAATLLSVARGQEAIAAAIRGQGLVPCVGPRSIRLVCPRRG